MFLMYILCLYNKSVIYVISEFLCPAFGKKGIYSFLRVFVRVTQEGISRV